ncbi:MAG TPA: hypothetical protein DD733_10500, partial [Clostridiales bacterium]|nr:hypothetical protein [Clostridiales bacterium]
MINLEKFPAAISEYFTAKGIDMLGALMTMKSDIGADSVYKDVYIVVDTEYVTVAEGTVVFKHERIR